MRRPPSNNPVTDVQSTDIRCNVNGLSASGTNPVPEVCAVNAGDEITVCFQRPCPYISNSEVNYDIQVIWDTSSHPGPIQHFLYGMYSIYPAKQRPSWWACNLQDLLVTPSLLMDLELNGPKSMFWTSKTARWRMSSWWRTAGNTRLSFRKTLQAGNISWVELDYSGYRKFRALKTDVRAACSWDQRCWRYMEPGLLGVASSISGMNINWFVSNWSDW